MSLWGFDLRRRLCWRKIKLKRFGDSRAWRRKRLDFSRSNTLQMNLRLEFISLRADELMTTRWVWPLAEQQVWMMQGGGCSRDTFSAALLCFRARAKTGSGGFPLRKTCFVFYSWLAFSSAQHRGSRSHASDTKPPAVTNSWQRNLIGAFPITVPDKVRWLATR